MRRVLPALLALLPLLAAPVGGVAQALEPLELRFLDVGQADAIVIQLGRTAALVDAGRGDDIVLVLEELGIDSLVAAIGSHNHDDHIGGMDAVLWSVPVGMYLSNGREPGNTNADNVEANLEEKQVPTPTPPWQPIRLGDATIRVFPSPLEDGPSENNASLVVLVERGGFTALLTGDSEREELAALLQVPGLIPDVDVLKAAHHGADDAVSPGWIHRTRPEVVVISAGRGNAYGHPCARALQYYHTGGRKVYRTDRDGTVVVRVEPDGAYTVETMGPRE